MPEYVVRIAEIRTRIISGPGLAAVGEAVKNEEAKLKGTEAEFKVLSIYPLVAVEPEAA